MSKFRGSITLSIFSLSTLSNYHYWQSPKTHYWRLVRPYQTGIPPARLPALIWAHDLDVLHSPNLKLFYLRSINPMIEKINPTIPIPITSSPIPDEQREIIMAKSSIAIPNPIFFIVNPPLQIPIYCSILYLNYTIKLVNNSTATLEYMRKARTVFCPDFLAQS